MEQSYKKVKTFFDVSVSVYRSLLSLIIRKASKKFPCLVELEVIAANPQ